MVLKIVYLDVRPVMSLKDMPTFPPIGVLISEDLEHVKGLFKTALTQYWDDYAVDEELLRFHSVLAEDGLPTALALDFKCWMQALHDVSKEGDCPSWMHVPGLRESTLGTGVFEVREIRQI